MDFLVAKSAIWNDDAVHGGLDSASFWVKGLPFVKSLSGYWRFFLASSPKMVPENFYDMAFQDFEWETLPGMYMNTCVLSILCILCAHSCFILDLINCGDYYFSYVFLASSNHINTHITCGLAVHLDCYGNLRFFLKTLSLTFP